MKKVGIWLAAALAAFYLTSVCAFAQTSGTAGTTANGAASQTKTKETVEEQDIEEIMGIDETPVSETTDTVETEDTESDDSGDTDSATDAEDANAEDTDAEEAEVQPKDAALRELINSIELNPETTGNEELDALVQSTLEEITASDMDVYDQVQACYDYLTSNMRYSWSGGRYYTPVLDTSTTATALFQSEGRINGYGALALSTNSGQCNDYASAFILLTRALGLDVNLANGKTLGSGGGYIRHYWAEMELDGVRYVFDPQLEQSLARYNKGSYSVFGKTYAEVGGRYVYYGTTAV